MEKTVKKRIIRVSGMTCGGCETNVEQGLSTIGGVLKVKADRRGTVRVEYDLRKVTVEMLENKIIDLGFTLSSGFFSKLKRDWTHNGENVERNNMSLPTPACCSKPTEPIRTK